MAQDSPARGIGRRQWLGQAALSGWAATAAGAAVAGALSATAPAAAAAPAPGLPAMRRGLNLTHWFEYERAQGLSLAEMQQLRAAGFDHVRLPVDPVVCGWTPGGAPGLPVMDELAKALEDAGRAGLVAVLDLHLEPADKQRIEADARARAGIVALWRWLARECAGLPRGQLVFELFNEPQFYGTAGARWPAFQAAMLDAVRSQAGSHGVLLSGARGGSVEGLQRLRPAADPAVGYVFHYYAPYLFTHQGAHWMDTRYTTAGLHRGVRYPAALQAGQPALTSAPHPRAAAEMAEYLEQDWGPARIARDLRVAAAWAREHRVALICNEFGVLRAAADAASRYRWIADVRQLLEAEGIGWTLWDYTDIFGITAESAQTGRRGARSLEPAARTALGLDEPVSALRARRPSETASR